MRDSPDEANRPLKKRLKTALNSMDWRRIAFRSAKRRLLLSERVQFGIPIPVLRMFLTGCQGTSRRIRDDLEQLGDC